MNCAEWQKKIALFTGADLPADEAFAVENHLSICDECRAVERELAETRAMLLSLRCVDDQHLAGVRSNVLDQLRRPKKYLWLPYAAAIAIFVFAFALRQRPTTPAPPVPPRPVGQTVPSATRVPARETIKTKWARPKPKPKSEPTVVTLFTDDPDVVIVWITD